jgi:hypothetical protein
MKTIFTSRRILTSITVLVSLLILSAADIQAAIWYVHHDISLTLNAKQVAQYGWQAGVLAIAEGPKPNVKDTKPNTYKAGPAFPPGASTPPPEKAVSGPTTASAYAKFKVNVNANTISGFHEIGGETKLNGGVLASSTASSALGLLVGTKDGKGNIKWNPNWSIDRIGYGRDPIDFSVRNLDTDELIETQLLEIALDSGTGTVASWQNGHIQLQGGDGLFFINMDSPYITSGCGTLKLAFANGKVTESYASGVFSSIILPSIDESANLDFMFGDSAGNISIDFDFGEENTNGYEFTAALAGSGEISEVIPEPVAFAVWTGLCMLCLLGHAWRRRKMTQ